MSGGITPANYLGPLHGRDSYEICAIEGRELIRVGNFDDARKAEQAACEHDGKAKGLYVTINPTNKRGANPEHLRRGRRCGANDMRRRAHWYLDADSVRPNPTNTNATEHEHAAALHRRDDVAEWIVKQGGPEPRIMGDSGNGGYSAYTLAHGATEIKRAHDALCEHFSNAYVTLDKSVTNLDRLSPLAGTWKRKGPDSALRPHRRTSATFNDDAGEITPEFLAYLTSLWPTSATTPHAVELLDYNGTQLPAVAIEFLTHPPTPGARNAGLFASARAMRDAGLSEQHAHDTLTPVALAIGKEARNIASVIRSTYAHTPAHMGHETTLAFISQWRAVVVDMSTQKQTRAGMQKTRVALALADIAERVKKIEVGAGVRDVSIGAALSAKQTAAALNSLRRDDGLLYCTNLRKRDVSDARTYKLTIPKDVVTRETLIEQEGQGDSAAHSMSVSLVTTWLQHEFVSTKTGSVVAQILQAAWAEPLTMSQMRKATGRKPETLTKALQVMRDARLITSKKVVQRGNATEAWRLTTIDAARILAVFDKLAIRFKAIGRREYLRQQYIHERDLFHRCESEQSTADAIRDAQRTHRKSSGIRAAAANMNARSQGKTHFDRVELKEL